MTDPKKPNPNDKKVENNKPKELTIQEMAAQEQAIKEKAAYDTMLADPKFARVEIDQSWTPIKVVEVKQTVTIKEEETKVKGGSCTI